MINNCNPLVSVIMPAYNAEKYINVAIDSILNQSYSNFELLVIDDGSKDNTAQIIKAYSDPRVKYVKNEQNMGLVKTLNKAISLSTGKYIARMDADDIALTMRIEKEVDYMETHQDCIICGGYAKSFVENDGNKKIIAWLKCEVQSEKIKNELAYHCCFVHPTVMFRSSVFDKTDIRYNDDYLNSEDYKYWIDLMEYGQYHNIPECLLLYRLSSSQMSASSDITIVNSNRCRLQYIEKAYGKEILGLIKSNKPSVSLIKRLKSEKINNPYLYKLLYFNFQKYSIKDFCYYIFCGDIFKYSFKTALQLFKRVIVTPEPFFNVSSL